MNTKKKIAQQIRDKVKESIEISQWTGEWLSHRIEVSKFVSFKDRHSHAEWGKKLQKALGKNFKVTLTSSGYRVPKSQYESNRHMLFVNLVYSKVK